MPTVGGISFTLAGLAHETSQTSGTGSYELLGAAHTRALSFVAELGDGVRTCYLAIDDDDYELGLGTPSAGTPDTLTRDGILRSSNSDNAVNWGTSPRDIYAVMPPDLGEQIWPEPTFMDLRAEQATTSGTTKDFTSIDSNAFRITVFLDQVNVAGATSIIVQLGDSGGFETTNYRGSASVINDSDTPVTTANSNGFRITARSDASLNYSGVAVIERMSSNKWACRSSVGVEATNDENHIGGGLKSLSSTLTQVRLASADGATAFGNGAVAIRVEYET